MSRRFALWLSPLLLAFAATGAGAADLYHRRRPRRRRLLRHRVRSRSRRRARLGGFGQHLGTRRRRARRLQFPGEPHRRRRRRRRHFRLDPQRLARIGVLLPGPPVFGAGQGRLRVRQSARLRNPRLGVVGDRLQDLGNSSGQTVKGVAFGVGVEYPITRNVSLRAELLRYDFGGATYVVPPSPLVADDVDQRRAHRRERAFLSPARPSGLSGRDGAGRRRRARRRPSPRRPARRGCRRMGRGGLW